MKFLYEYRTSDNAKHGGVIKAADSSAAYALLKSRGIKPSRFVEAPGFFNKLFGKGKRWIAIAVLGVLCLALCAVVLGTGRGARSAVHEFDATARRQVIGDAEYRIGRDPTLVCVVEANRRGTGWRRIFSFDTTPQLPVDFAYAHYWCETHPSSSFRRRYWVCLPQADGSVRTLSLEPDPETGEPTHVLAHIRPGEAIERTWLRSDAAFAAALGEHFGIVEG